MNMTVAALCMESTETATEFPSRMNRKGKNQRITVSTTTRVAVSSRPSSQIGNVIKVIKPYLSNSMWVFDDETCGLVREPFVCGADEIISRISEHIPGREKGFVLVFSEHAIPDATMVVHHDRKGENGVGDYYVHRASGMRGWLCPALMCYFPKAPKAIYAVAKPISPPMVGGRKQTVTTKRSTKQNE